MSMRHTLPTFGLVITLVFAGVSAKAYEFTGNVKTIPSGAWHHWQEITLKKGDDSVWTPCQRFVTRLRDLTATPVAFSTKECVELSEQLSGVTDDQHDSLPIGQSMWVPYVPVDVTAADVAVLSARAPFDPSVLEAALADVQATVLSKDDITLLIADSATALEAALTDQIQALRTELTDEQSNNNGMLIARLGALEQAMAAGQPVSETTAMAPPVIADKLKVLATQVNDLAGLHSQVTAMEERLGAVEATLEKKADTKTVEELAAKVNELEQKPIVTQTDLDSVKVALAGKADAKETDELFARLQKLEDKPSVGGATPVTETDLFWWLVALSVASVASLGLIGWLFGRTSKTKETVKDHASRIQAVESALDLVVTYNAQQRFACPKLTDDLLNDLPVDGKPIRLTIKEIGTGAVHPAVDIVKGKNNAGDEYLILVGTKNVKSEQINPKTIKGNQTFKVAQIFKQLDSVIQKGEIVGVTKGRELL